MTHQTAPAAPPRRGRPGYDRRGLLDVAVQTFIERGYDATSIATLAERLGLSKSAIYHHFSSKEQILAAALDEALDALEAALPPPAPRAEDAPLADDAAETDMQSGARVTPGAGSAAGHGAQATDGEGVHVLEHVLREAVHVLVDRLPYVTLLLRVRGNTATERAALARRRAFDKRVTAVIEAAQRSGELRADLDPRVAERLIFGMINSIVEWYRPAGRESADSLADDVVTLALSGLRAP
ncbi:TetR/AcrR family transcriptional regulator [Myceligenerans pegani]|uniref:TetR family transcriptional regulator n=1 Tax=Myceligenerans pegani TaxID=2776917 RepID=A0ABR9N1B3_9MICO|nr:TetR/AcrR family transcriptional regulator [Myceligenerans sp. TRM 65318]MBE1876939.1 TetR family transcriptional regulator [Myceligenerans sp. TRM 65318]MBE3019210.1 TetR family transcriptional regulator [Myceligenerans sp. TRM 65318]